MYYVNITNVLIPMIGYRPNTSILVNLCLPFQMPVVIQGCKSISCPVRGWTVRVSFRGIHQNQILKVFKLSSEEEKNRTKMYHVS